METQQSTKSQTREFSSMKLIDDAISYLQINHYSYEQETRETRIHNYDTLFFNHDTGEYIFLAVFYINAITSTSDSQTQSQALKTNTSLNEEYSEICP